MTTRRALCRECLRAHRAPGQLRCTECHHRWLNATRQPDNPTPEGTTT